MDGVEGTCPHADPGVCGDRRAEDPCWRLGRQGAAGRGPQPPGGSSQIRWDEGLPVAPRVRHGSRGPGSGSLLAVMQAQLGIRPSGVEGTLTLFILLEVTLLFQIANSKCVLQVPDLGQLRHCGPGGGQPGLAPTSTHTLLTLAEPTSETSPGDGDGRRQA